MNEELDSQLSAMFDDELPEQQCELLARRLSRDEKLKARWGRYAAIGAAIRKEQGVRMDMQLAHKISAAIADEPPLVTEPAGTRKKFVDPAVRRWVQPVAGAALAASVAAVAILVLRAQAPAGPAIGGDSQWVAQTSGVQDSTLVSTISNSGSTEPDSYTVPQSVDAPAIVPSAELAKLVVAHSEFSMPLGRRFSLSSFMGSDQGTASGSGESEEQAEDRTPDAEQAQ